jgi:hypothetical protein
MNCKDSDFHSEEEESEKSNGDTINPFCKERSPIEYYNWERDLKEQERKCRCTNEDLLSDDFCEKCNSYIY